MYVCMYKQVKVLNNFLKNVCFQAGYAMYMIFAVLWTSEIYKNLVACYLFLLFFRFSD